MQFTQYNSHSGLRDQSLKQIHTYDIYEKIGTHYGFPLCCINSFRDGIHKINAELYKVNMPNTGIKNTGYIPCIEHLNLLTNKQVTIDELFKNRQCESSFPNGMQCNPHNRCKNWIK